MAERKVQTFFYGSYMNFDVLKEAGLAPERWEVTRLNGYDIRIEPRANLVRSEQHCVYGIIATATHDELARLWAVGRFGRSCLAQRSLWDCWLGAIPHFSLQRFSQSPF